MDLQTHHNLPLLFEQLGLDSAPQAIEQFIKEHRGLPDALRLSEAPFWSDAQADFLRQQILADGDWAIVVDELNTRLRDPATLHG